MKKTGTVPVFLLIAKHGQYRQFFLNYGYLVCIVLFVKQLLRNKHNTGLAMYRLRLLSSHFGIDEKGPLYTSREAALNAAQLMLRVHSYPVRVEVIQFMDASLRETRLVAVLENTAP